MRALNAALRSSKALVGVRHLQSTLPSNRKQLAHMQPAGRTSRRAAAQASSSVTDIPSHAGGPRASPSRRRWGATQWTKQTREPCDKRGA